MSTNFLGRPLDIVLFVIGGNGAGKSTFINYILEEIGHSQGSRSVRMGVHDALSPCTRSIQPVRLQPTRGEYPRTLERVVLVDGPGLEDANPDQHNKVLSDLKAWVSHHYNSLIRPHLGIIYIQDVSLCPLDTFTISLNLKSPISLAKLIDCESTLLATMKWGKLSPNEAHQATAVTASWPKKCMASTPIVHNIKQGTEGPSAMATISYFLAVFDAVLPGSGQEADIAILVLGPLKCGKSTFVNAVLMASGQPPHMQVSDSLTSTTTSVESAVLRSHAFSNLGDRRIVLLDAPGFVGDDMDDAAILRSISTWFSTRYKGSRPVTCLVVYLHDISQDGFTRTASQVMELLPQLVHKISLKKVVIATTKWDRSFEDEGYAREVELQTKFWSGISTGCCISRRLTGQSPHLSLVSEILQYV